MNCGNHPDVVEWVWRLGRGLAAGARCLIYGTPALIDPETGVILAVCFGTAYAIRLPADSPKPPRNDVVQKWSFGGTTNIERRFGRGWKFGDFSRGEFAALKKVRENFHEQLSEPPA